MTLLIGSKESKASAKPCAQLAKVDDLGSAVAVCKGSGSWLFIAVSAADSTPAPSLSLAEVEVCDPNEATPAFQSPFLRGVDASAGLREMVEEGLLVQVAPELLPTAPEHDAALARLAGAAEGGGGWGLGLGAVLALLGVGLLAWRRGWAPPLPGGCAPRGHMRIAAEDKRDAHGLAPAGDEGMEGDEEALSDEEEEGEEEEEEEGAEAGAGAPGDGVPVTFETSDGTAIQWSIRLGGVLGMEQLFARVEKAAAQAGFDPIGHLSVQYTDRATGMVEQAWHDRVLGEGTDVEIVKSATQLRVLLLGGVHRGAAPPPSAVPRVAGPPGQQAMQQARLHVDEGDLGAHDPVNRI